MQRVGLIDYGAGNFCSVQNALRYLDLDVIRITEAKQMDQVSHLILPGVGAFAAAMKKLTSLDLVGELQRQLNDLGKPFLGICVGMQLLASVGREFGNCPGLGVVPGVVDCVPAEEFNLRLPHIGWSEVEICSPSPLFRGLPENPIFYFVHSYAMNPGSPKDVLATCEYGSKIVAAIQRDNVYGVQFHPEKSQKDGLALLKNFVSLETS